MRIPLPSISRIPISCRSDRIPTPAQGSLQCEIVIVSSGMTLEQLPRLTLKALYLETDIEGIDYGQNGTCTLLKDQGRFIIVTALSLPLAEYATDRGRNPLLHPEHLWIPQTLTTSRPESFGLCNPRVARSPTHRAASDFAVVGVLEPPSDYRFL